MRTIVCDPSTTRQLGDTGPWIFWRPSPTGSGRQQGLAVSAHVCDNLDCPCTEANLAGVVIDDRVRKVGLSNDDFRLTYHAGTKPAGGEGLQIVQASVDFSTAQFEEVAPDDGAHADVLEWLRTETSGELLDLLYAGWMRARGIDPSECRPVPDAPSIRRGDSVPWRELFWGRHDLYDAGDERYQPLDRYCIDPQCECREVTVSFMRQTEPPAPGAFAAQGKWKDAGAVGVDLPSGEVCSFHPDMLNEFELLQRWEAVRSRYRDVGAFLGRRYNRMKAYGRQWVQANPSAAAVASPATGRKPGRNEPCPCGSGKKFKRCCGAP